MSNPFLFTLNFPCFLSRSAAVGAAKEDKVDGEDAAGGEDVQDASNQVQGVKCCGFTELCQFCCSAGILSGGPSMKSGGHTEEKPREARVWNLFLNFQY